MASQRTLDTLKPGEQGKIATIGGSGLLRRRLLDMGLTPGTQVKVVKRAPFGDPVELFLRGYDLSIRLMEAAQISIEDVAN